jgi:hypothetical protein
MLNGDVWNEFFPSLSPVWSQRMPKYTFEQETLIRELATVRAELAERRAAQESFGEALELVGSRYAEILAQHRALQIVCAALYVELSARGDRPETGLGDMLERLRTGVVRASARSGLSPRLASAAIAAVEEVVETAKHMGETG